MKVALTPSMFSVFLSSEFICCIDTIFTQATFARATKDLSGLKRTEE